jgi:hypothetical protein
MSSANAGTLPSNVTTFRPSLVTKLVFLRFLEAAVMTATYEDEQAVSLSAALNDSSPAVRNYRTDESSAILSSESD